MQRSEKYLSAYKTGKARSSCYQNLSIYEVVFAMFKHRAFWLIIGVLVIGLTRWGGDFPSSPQAYAEKKGLIAVRVHHGDTVYRIAKQHGTDVATLARITGFVGA
jgi:hypothetical protein